MAAKPRKTLARRIFALVFGMSTVVMLATAIALTGASFARYEHDAEYSLLARAEAITASLRAAPSTPAMCDALAALPLSGARCTLIGADGTALFDTFADASTMDNHGARQEVLAARKDGEGITLRKSETLGTDTIYAAVLVRDGIVLRLAESRPSLASFLGGMTLPIGLSLVGLLALSFLATRLLTRMVMRPLHCIDVAAPLANDAYAEIQPLLVRMDEQRRALAAQNEELARAVNLRREFTGNVTHELKSPLQVIGGYAELMENGLVPAEDVPRFAGLIKQESDAMGALINDILTLSSLDENQSFDAERVDVAAACRRVVARLASKSAERQVRVIVQAAGAACVQGTAKLVEQVVYNLVDNAITYSPEGGCVSVRVRVAAEKSAGQVTLVVADEGPGIPDEFKQRVFERFFRVDGSRSRNTGGTGLGLAIVKHAVDTLGGTVHVGDAHPHGATFTITLPAAL